MRRFRTATLLLGLALPLGFAPAPASAQQLTLERIFASPDFQLQGLAPRQWLRDGERYSMVEYNPERRTTDLVIEEARTGKRTRAIDGANLVPSGARAPILIEDYAWSADESKLLIYTNSQQVWRQNTKGTFYVYELATRRLTPVSTAPGWQQFAKLSPDGKRVGFVRDNNLFVTDLASGREIQLTKDGSENVINGTFDWVYEEELDLRDGWRWSPDGKRIAFWRLDQSPVKTFYMINDLPTYAEPIGLRYPKAGEANSVAKIGVIDLEGSKTTWIDTGADTDVYLARMEWADSPSELIIQRLNRHQNRNDLLLADAVTGKSRTLLSDTDKAWVEIDADPAFINDGKRFIWASEKDGYKHLYLYNRDGSLVHQITKGPWEVTGFYGYDARSGWIYFSAAEKSPLERHLYRIRLDGKGLERITRDAGTHSINFNAGFRYYIDTYSRAGVPPAAGLYQVDGKPVRTLVDNARVAERLASARLSAPEFFTFKTSDGVELNGSMIKPADFDPTKKYPVLMYVYGGPGSQMVTDAWGGARYLWHQHLAQKGVVVVTIDNRGTGGQGSAFKKATYLNLGKWETHDQIEGARYLARLPYVDPARIGIWGWSYGGYMTALTLMKGGDLFRAGISVAPVTDWKLYDTIYTERFMRTPKENPEGYRESAPVEQVDGLKSRFLLIHGTLDDNVHFQNAIQLASALQQAGKQFDFMAYPNKNHSISGGNTSLHLYTLMTDWVQKNLVGGQVTP